MPPRSNRSTAGRSSWSASVVTPSRHGSRRTCGPSRSARSARTAPTDRPRRPRDRSEVTHPDLTPDVPFAGLRRHARALLAGAALLLVMFVLVPDLTPRASELPPVQLVRGRIVEVLPEVDPSTPNVRIEVIDGIEGGPATGEVVEGFLQGPSGLEARPDFSVGDDVIVNISTDPDFGFVAVNDRYRVPTLALLLGLFAVAVTIVGGWRGVRSLIALALTLAVIVRVVVPLILAGWDPAWVAIVSASGVTVATFL